MLRHSRIPNGFARVLRIVLTSCVIVRRDSQELHWCYGSLTGGSKLKLKLLVGNEGI